MRRGLAEKIGHHRRIIAAPRAFVLQRHDMLMGKVVLPEPIRASTTSAGVRREADRTWRGWLGLVLDFCYVAGQT